MDRISLDGAWQAARAGTDDWFAAQVPGCVHTALLAAGRIEDPFFRDNEDRLQWITEAGWVYRRDFDVPGRGARRASGSCCASTGSTPSPRSP